MVETGVIRMTTTTTSTITITTSTIRTKIMTTNGATEGAREIPTLTYVGQNEAGRLLAI
ncbi:hypothetical protein CVIRNUC_007158 [Coccomyxa viridis]|uniref:Uncharacterized protein n=1 Tax=Coccomyxa viridis TaxID=1274662 RepID=A0AAV1IBQ7_9CHLO|nr:hypothetical protein CVIRNUC_007158 [Coccomyxa viridis]